MLGCCIESYAAVRAGAARAPVVIVALLEIEPARLAVQRLRRVSATVPILARAHGRKEAEYLMAVGASEVIQAEIEAAGTVIRHVLEQLGLPKEQVLDYLERFRETGKSNEVTAIGS